MRNKFFKTGIACVGFLVASPFAFAHGPGPRGEGGPGRGPKDPAARFERLSQELQLNQQQQDKIKKLFTDYRTSKESLREQLRTAKERQDKLWQDAQTKPELLRQASREVSALEAQMAEKHVDFRLGIKQVLSAEQYLKFNEKFERRGKGHFGKRGKGHGRGHGHFGPRGERGPRGEGPEGGKRFRGGPDREF